MFANEIPSIQQRGNIDTAKKLRLRDRKMMAWNSAASNALSENVVYVAPNQEDTLR
jgi:hypothetical protein